MDVIGLFHGLPLISRTSLSHSKQGMFAKIHFLGMCTWSERNMSLTPHSCFKKRLRLGCAKGTELEYLIGFLSSLLVEECQPFLLHCWPFTVGWLITSQFLFFFDVAVVEPPIGYLSTGHRPSPGCVRPKPLRMRSSLSLRRDETNDIAEGVRKRRIRRSAQAVIRTMAC